jgi:hypothetical protein
MLIEAGATGTQRDFFGERPIDYAKPDSACHTMLLALEPPAPAVSTTGSASAVKLSDGGADGAAVPAAAATPAAKDSPSTRRAAVI